MDYDVSSQINSERNKNKYRRNSKIASTFQAAVLNETWKQVDPLLNVFLLSEISLIVVLLYTFICI